MPVLTAIDVIGIQSYIFASNRLRDVVGASYLVDWATREDGGLRVDNVSIAAPDILLAAGGNAILSFPTMHGARQFILHYSRQLLERAPGVEVAIAHQEFDEGKLARGLLALQVQLAKAKLSRRPHAPQHGLSVMQPCAITGLPASTLVQGDWLCQRLVRIRAGQLLEDAKRRWNEFLPADGRPQRCQFPTELDKLGRTYGDTSLIGIVHIDGNGIGRRIQRWLVGKLEGDSTTDKTLKDEYRRWSNALKDLGRAVLQAVTRRLMDRIEPGAGSFHVRGQPSRQLDFELRTDSGDILLPMRPILLGGDDLTFICDGRVALDLATTALKTFKSASTSNKELALLSPEAVTACAGVALVKAHAPFSRSYELCEALCKSAKEAKRAADSANPSSSNDCWIDWHVGTTRPDESVRDIRLRQYQGTKLTCRPYPLTDASSPRPSWEWLDRELLGEPGKDPNRESSFRNPRVWGERRNKVKALARLASEGRDAIREQLEVWKTVAPEIKLPSGIDVDGFKGQQTPLLDAIELLDLHLRLEAPLSSPWAESEKAEVNR